MALGDADFVSLVDTYAPALKKLQRVSGVSSAALLESVAQTLGRELAKAMTSTSFDSLIDELGLLFGSLGLGKISVEGRSPSLRLTVKECSGCAQPSNVENSNCALRETILKAIFEERLGVESNVKLLSSRGRESSEKTCKFIVKLGSNLMK